MDDKTTKNTTTESIQNIPSKTSFLYTIKSATSLMVLGSAPQIKNVGWKEDIRAKQQMLCAELRKVKNGWRYRITLAGVIELVNDVFRNVKDNHSDLYREDFTDKLTTIFMKDLLSCRQELKNDIDRIFIESRDINPYREVLNAGIKSIFSKYNGLDLRRRNLEDYIVNTINSGISNPDLYCRELNG